MSIIYKDLFPTCPRCKNERLVIQSGVMGDYYEIFG